LATTFQLVKLGLQILVGFAKLVIVLLQLPTNGFVVGFSAAFLPFLVFCFFFGGGCSQSQLRLLPLQEAHNTKEWILVWPACPQTVD